jgi:hypothetical protein
MDIAQKKGSSFGWSEEAISLAKQVCSDALGVRERPAGDSSCRLA